MLRVTQAVMAVRAHHDLQQSCMYVGLSVLDCEEPTCFPVQPTKTLASGALSIERLFVAKVQVHGSCFLNPVSIMAYMSVGLSLILLTNKTRMLLIQLNYSDTCQIQNGCSPSRTYICHILGYNRNI